MARKWIPFDAAQILALEKYAEFGPGKMFWKAGENWMVLYLPANADISEHMQPITWAKALEWAKARIDG